MTKFIDVFIKYANEFEPSIITLEPAYNEDNIPYLIKEEFHITEFLSEKKAYIFLGNKNKELTKDRMRQLATKIAQLPRDIQIDYDKFNSNFLKYLIEVVAFVRSDIFSVRSDAEKTKAKFKDIIVVSKNVEKLKPLVDKYQTINQAVNFARHYQNMPPNIANSEFLAKKIEEKLSKNPNLTVRVLNAEQIKELKMNLFLSVNRGSTYEPRLVVIEYNGSPGSEHKTAFVGKGITFDSGGYNLKPSSYMANMKYDMSGAIISAAAMDAIAKFAPVANVCAVLPLTDNRVNGDANTPDAVWKSMNGKTVEINNTDAEGRLVLADAMTYAIRELKASEVITIATLTGAIRVALGETFTGAFATDDKLFKTFNEATKESGELIWRMPLHKDFAQEIRKSSVADLKNTDLTGAAGSSSAAMFLDEFSEGKPFLHLDIAGTADVKRTPTGVMTKSLIEFILKK
ncbi:M17 family metallopeptidase [Mesomycoplasma bovoculi]|uniref:Probable cytosol aminopeptidase n=1 Tax=Mesomycoplasma bovoculi M165/69 TaxID=743966 RepID=W5USN8_9BACT|nr:M17 family metallopeptidase [Mesomycoplasma bovoculi]AHH45147.1 leucyl aminopeptidase [Mesomycoplasma bovoculi M165/69]